MIESNTQLINIVRISKEYHAIMDKYFNPNHNCFSCIPLAYATLKDACEIRGYDLEHILKELNNDITKISS